MLTYFIDTQKADEAFWKQKKTCCAPSKKKQLFFGINSAPSKEVDDAQNRVSLSNAIYTGKFLSEALIFASTNQQYDDRLFIFHEKCKFRIPAEHVVYTNCCFCFVLTFRTILVHNMFCRCCELLKKIYLYKKGESWKVFCGLS